MKKNKTQLKKGKKNLRREKERIMKMKLYRGKEVSGDVSPLRIDITGNITRLINKKGSVLPTETKMYGCEIEKSVPQFIRRFVDKIGLGEMIRVPIQEKGLTGSGKTRECHTNVLGLVKRFRGQLLRGYGVGMYDGGKVSFYYHSVWITPEGKCRDITNNYKNRGHHSEDCIIRKGDKEYMLFLPIGLGRIVELGIDVNDVLILSDWEKTGVSIINEEDYDILPINCFDHFQKKIGFINTHYKRVRYTTEEMKELMERGGFSQKSLGSGKSWDELKSEIVW